MFTFVPVLIADGAVLSALGSSFGRSCIAHGASQRRLSTRLAADPACLVSAPLISSWHRRWRRCVGRAAEPRRAVAHLHTFGSSEQLMLPFADLRAQHQLFLGYVALLGTSDA